VRLKRKKRENRKTVARKKIWEREQRGREKDILFTIKDTSDTTGRKISGQFTHYPKKNGQLAHEDRAAKKRRLFKWCRLAEQRYPQIPSPMPVPSPRRVNPVQNKEKKTLKASQKKTSRGRRERFMANLSGSTNLQVLFKKSLDLSESRGRDKGPGMGGKKSKKKKVEDTKESLLYQITP